MIYALFGIAVVSFALWGMADVYKSIALALRCPKISDSVMIIPISENNENVEFAVRSAAAAAKYISILKNQKIICLDCGMDNETRTICEKLCADYGFISIMTTDELQKYLLGLK